MGLLDLPKAAVLGEYDHESLHVVGFQDRGLGVVRSVFHIHRYKMKRRTYKNNSARGFRVPNLFLRQ